MLRDVMQVLIGRTMGRTDRGRTTTTGRTGTNGHGTTTTDRQRNTTGLDGTDGQMADDDAGTDDGMDGLTKDADGDDGTDGRYIQFQSFKYDIGTMTLK